MPSSLAVLARTLGRVARDRWDPRSSLPARIDDLDAATLSRIIGRPVGTLRAMDGTEGTTDRRRMAIDGDDPATVFVKMPPRASVARVFGDLVGLGSNEVRFYRDVRRSLDLDAPAVHGLALDDRTGRYVLVLEDLAAADVRFTSVTTPLAVGEMQAVLATLAGLHAALWASPRLADEGDLAWVPRLRDDPFLRPVARLAALRTRKLAASRADLVPPSAAPIVNRYPAIAWELDQGPTTLLHGDPHPGNAYLRDGRAGLFDWQVVRRGHHMRDVTYALVFGLDPATRRDHEADLLAHYRRSLADAGGPSLEPADLELDHRAMAAYPYVAAAFTVALGGLQRDDVAVTGLARAAAAIEDLHTLDALTERRDREVRRSRRRAH